MATLSTLFATPTPTPAAVPISDGSSTLDAWVTDGTGGGGGTPGGADTQLQYNAAGTFGGVSGAISDGSSVTFASDKLRATFPRITGGVADANANELFIFTATGLAVNELTYANAAAGAAPRFTASGSDTNIGIDFAPKGTGDFTIFCSPGSTSPHGLTLENSNGAPLLRFNRSATAKSAIGVASGTNSLILGDAVDEFDFLSINSKAINFSANGGTFIQFRINPAGEIAVKQTTNDNTGGLRTYRSDTSAYVTYYMGGDDNAYYDLRVGGTHEFYCNGSFAGRIGTSGLFTASPSGGTQKFWKLGNRANVNPTSPNRTVEVEVDGVTLYLAAKTTND